VTGIGVCVLAALAMVRSPREGGRLPLAEVPWRMRLAWLGACCAALLASPLGTGIVDYIRDVSDVPLLQELTPLWAGLELTSWRAWYLFGLLATALIGAWKLRGDEGWRTWLPIVPLVLAGAVAFDAARGIVAFSMLAVPEVARAIGGHCRDRSWPATISSRPIAFALVGVLAFGLVGLFPGMPLQRDLARNGLPSERQLASIREGDRVFASAEWADYVHVRTGARVFIDARLERYRERDLRTYLDVLDDHCDIPEGWILMVRDGPKQPLLCSKVGRWRMTESPA
jgi:hypothetical protein